MPLEVAQILKLNYTKSKNSYFQMDSSNVNMVGKVKDIIFNLSVFLTRKILVSILVVDMPIAYGMLLGR